MCRWCLVFCLAFGSLALADWPQWRGINRDGGSEDSPPLRESLPDDGLEPLWLNKEVISGGRGEGWSSPVVARGKVYLATIGPAKDKPEFRNEHLVCLNAETGKELWRHIRESKKTKFPQSCTPTVVDNHVYHLGAGLTALCVDAATGDEVWQTQLSEEVNEECWMSSPVVVDGVLIVFAQRLAGLDAQSGEVRWTGKDSVKEGVYGSPTVFESAEGNLVIAHVGQGDTVAVQPRSGAEQWREKTEAINSSPVIHKDLLITLGNSRKGGLRCYRLSNDGPELQWKYQKIADPGSSPVVVDEHVFVQGERQLACLRLEDGKQMWTESLDFKDPRYTSLVAADGKVFYALESLFTFAADPTEFRLLYRGLFNRQGLLAEEKVHRERLGLNQVNVSLEGETEADKKWRQAMEVGPVACTSPAISDGRLFVRLRSGLACYQLSK